MSRFQTGSCKLSEAEEPYSCNASVADACVKEHKFTMLQRFGFQLPIVQAPMAGVSTPALAAAVCEAGALGSLGLGATDASGAGILLTKLRGRTSAAFNANVFVHQAPKRRPEREAAWLTALRPTFLSFDVEPPSTLDVIYRSFNEDDAMLRLLVQQRPAVISFHFGLPEASRVVGLKEAGCFLLATVTNTDEATAAEKAGMDGLVAQGWEAGGHRGIFNPQGSDTCLGTLALTRLLARRSGLPVIAAGGIMDGRGIRAVLDLGAAGAQLGTAFIACPESNAGESYRAALFSSAAEQTTMTHAISGRPARCLMNHFTSLAENLSLIPPDYPIAYDAGKALNYAAK